jgi:hypothetical protein
MIEVLSTGIRMELLSEFLEQQDLNLESSSSV